MAQAQAHVIRLLQDRRQRYAFGHCSVHSPQYKNDFSYDTLRFNQLPPVNSTIRQHCLFSRHIDQAYKHSGHIDIDCDLCMAPRDQGLTRFYCPSCLDETHGVLQLRGVHGMLANPMLVESSLLCNCHLVDAQSQDNRFYSLFTVKYETRASAHYAIVRKFLFLYTVYHVKITTEYLPHRIDDLHGDTVFSYIYFNPITNNGNQQKIRFKLSKQSDGYLLAMDPLPDARTQNKHCANCNFRNDLSSNQGDLPRLMVGLSCRHHLCEVCVLRCWGRNRPHAEYGPSRDISVEPICCPTCDVHLRPVLFMPFPECTEFPAPVPIYFYGMKAIYSPVTLDAVQTFIQNHIVWVINGMEVAENRLEEIMERRRVLYLYRNNSQPEDLSPEFGDEWHRVERAYNAWDAVRIHLNRKKVFLRWWYFWDQPFPKELLDQNRHYYTTVLEREFYLLLLSSAERALTTMNNQPVFQGAGNIWNHLE